MVSWTVWVQPWAFVNCMWTRCTCAYIISTACTVLIYLSLSTVVVCTSLRFCLIIVASRPSNHSELYSLAFPWVALSGAVRSVLWREVLSSTAEALGRITFMEESIGTEGMRRIFSTCTVVGPRLFCAYHFSGLPISARVALSGQCWSEHGRQVVKAANGLPHI